MSSKAVMLPDVPATPNSSHAVQRSSVRSGVEKVLHTSGEDTSEHPNLIPWGRQADGSWWTSVGAVVLLFGCPVWIISNWVALQHFSGSLIHMLQALQAGGIVEFIIIYGPRATWVSAFEYAFWIALQAMLYIVLPGPLCKGQLTPAGHLLEYTTNGLLAWFSTSFLAIAASVAGLIDPAVVADHWEGLLVAMNVYGLALAGFVWIKAHVAPSYPADRKFSKSSLYDIFVGIELNPRLGRSFDFKFWSISRPSMIAWTIVNWSYAAQQYKIHGYVSNSMVLVNMFALVYCVDFFINEDWYLRTIDIGHDHFGFYLAWGSSVLLPNIYTLQSQYLARFPVDLSTLNVCAILAVGFGGYAIFRVANHQKDLLRRSNGDCTIFGQKATYIRCTYGTEDGKRHESLLLTSGFWGISRHCNYLGDLMISFAACAPCGVSHVIPWYYAFFITAILVHRDRRDEQRCARKYGTNWEVYKRQVPWRIVPFVY